MFLPVNLERYKNVFFIFFSVSYLWLSVLFPHSECSLNYAWFILDLKKFIFSIQTKFPENNLLI